MVRPPNHERGGCEASLAFSSFVRPPAAAERDRPAGPPASDEQNER